MALYICNTVASGGVETGRNFIVLPEDNEATALLGVDSVHAVVGTSSGELVVLNAEKCEVDRSILAGVGAVSASARADDGTCVVM